MKKAILFSMVLGVLSVGNFALASEQISICGSLSHGLRSGALHVGQTPESLQTYQITKSSGDQTLALIANEEQKSSLQQAFGQSVNVTGSMEAEGFVVTAVQPVAACPEER